MRIVCLTIAFSLFACTLWLLRSYRWPRVQVRVLRTWQEVTHVNDEGTESGCLHAELEYWHEACHFTPSWRCDRLVRNHLPAALFMVIHPDRPHEPRLLPAWTRPVGTAMIAVFFLLAAYAPGP